MAKLVVAVFAIIALHELGHALAAWCFGVPVRRIILGVGPRWAALRVKVRSIVVEVRPIPLGGACDMDMQHAGPPGRVLIPLAGPAANIFFGLLVLGVVSGLDGLLSGLYLLGAIPRVIPSLLVSALTWMAPPEVYFPIPNGIGVAGGTGLLSILLGATNLIPLIPLDGGYVALEGLRAVGVRVPFQWAFRAGVLGLFMLHVPLFVRYVSPLEALGMAASGIVIGLATKRLRARRENDGNR